MQTLAPIQTQNQLVSIVNESGLEKTKAQILLDNFSNYFEIASDWQRKADSLVVNNIEQIAEMKMAREGRLFLKQKRVEVEKTRKQLKESALREGQTIDAIARILTNLIEPIEENLEQKEKYREIQEATRKAELKMIRESELQPYLEFVPFGLQLGEMSEDDFNKTITGARIQLKAKIEAEQKAEADRIAKEKAEEEERERMRIENEKLKAEREAREKELEKERARVAKEKAIADAKLKAEREAREKLEAEIKAKQEAEARAKKDEELKAAAELKAKQDEEKKLAKSGDKEKLRKWLTGFSKSNIEIQTKGEAGAVKEEIEKKFDSFLLWSNSLINSL